MVLSRKIITRRQGMTLLFGIAMLAAFAHQPSLADTPVPSSSSPAVLKLGERMYREGILPSGKPMVSNVQGKASAPGTTFACVGCHLFSGMGALEENVYTPAINGPSLFSPLYKVYKGVVQKQSPLLRPAYTEQTLAAAITTGNDPAGRQLNDIMPRYQLNDADAQVMVDYLKSLSAQHSPGVTDTTIRFATVITADAPLEEAEAMMTVLRTFFRNANGQINYFKTAKGGKARRMAENMLGSSILTDRTLNVSAWFLQGAPETWRSQLERYYGREPVFAIIGGLGRTEWQPVHRFCEDNGIPCLFPNTDLPVISANDRYTLYLSKGYYQEGEAAARYLAQREVMGRSVLQIVRQTPQGRALAAGFEQTWMGLGQEAPVTVTIPAVEPLTNERLYQELAQRKPAALIVWDDQNVLTAMKEALDRTNQPPMVLISSRYLGSDIWRLPESLRDRVFLTYPFVFRSYQPKGDMGRQQIQSDLQKTLKQAEVPLSDPVQRITSLSSSLTQLLAQGLMGMRGNFYRDNLLDVLGTMMDQQYPLYGRISLGPTQRYAVRGCYIVQLSKGEHPELVKKSDWEIQ